MKTSSLPAGTNHDKVPTGLKKALLSHDKALATWQSITPLARNEFICWVTSAKLIETNERRIVMAIDKLSRGERRPCCWIGCIHRTDKELSPSVRGILEKRKKQ